jgi:hypothetical protein
MLVELKRLQRARTISRKKKGRHSATLIKEGKHTAGDDGVAILKWQIVYDAVTFVTNSNPANA